MTEKESIRGKTYSLFGDHASANIFFNTVSDLTDRIMDLHSLDERKLWEFIQSSSRNKRLLRKSTGSAQDESILASLLHQVQDSLSVYTTGIEEHLKSAPFYKHLTDRRLLTIREQYYLYMIEFELVNRINRKRFLESNYRLALMPYCLRETQTECKAKPDEIDYECKGCLKTCQINKLSSLLRENNVEPYIWRTSKLKPLFRELVKKHDSIGVMGIACMVELVWGMRLCMKAGLPVVGIPLNANRCARWMDGFYETSVDLEAIGRLISGVLY